VQIVLFHIPNASSLVNLAKTMTLPKFQVAAAFIKIVATPLKRQHSPHKTVLQRNMTVMDVFTYLQDTILEMESKLGNQLYRKLEPGRLPIKQL
jgi:hypothetical protein